jgi:hypothetical protein
MIFVPALRHGQLIAAQSSYARLMPAATGIVNTPKLGALSSIGFA